MKLLLTSQGFTNESIQNALRELLGKPTQESKIVVIPTAQNAIDSDKHWVIEEDMLLPYGLDWKNFEIVDLAAMASLDKKYWWHKLEEADVLLFGGGNGYYLSYWLQESGVTKALPKWLKSKVYVGISAGSMVACHSLQASSQALKKFGELRDDEYDELGPEGQSSSKALQLTDFVFRPHLDSKDFPKIRLEFLSKVAGTLDVPMYACDDDTAIKVTDDGVEVITEGTWKLFEK